MLYAFKEAGFGTSHHLFGHSAITEITSQQVDFVVLDIGLPDMTGFEVCKKIRAISNIPILFLTARNHEIDRIVGLEIGADDYVTKPFSPREVVTRVKTILRRTELIPAKQPSQFVVDEIANRILYCGQYLELTRYEFLLLKTLVNQPQRVYSRNQLMDLVWANAEGHTRTHCGRACENVTCEIAPVNPDTQAIVTHRGMGYSLLA